MSILTKPWFHNEKAAFAKLEAVLWPDGPICPHCGNAANIYDLSKNRIGLKKCGAKPCRKQFTVRVGTVFESSHIPLHKWLQAVHLLCSSKKGISSHQLHRVLEITYKSAWFMSHRIREAMRTGGLMPPLGGKGGTVEIDETFIGKKKGANVQRGYGHKHAIMTLVDRKGEARSFHVKNVRANTLLPIIKANIERETKIATDEATQYFDLKWHFADHQSVQHAKEEWARGDVHTNTVEGFFGLFKRGMKGVYQHCSEKHLHRYLAEFDFRYNNRSALGIEDEQRATSALTGAKGKRLTYARD
jgi:transposase-like protein